MVLQAEAGQPVLKPVKFVGSSKLELSEFPSEVRQDMGHALYVAQQGGRAPNVKTLQGFGGGSVVEIVEDFDGGTFRCVYTTRIRENILVLHVFQKKSLRGTATPQRDIDLVRSRLKDALERSEDQESQMTKSAFHELGLADADDLVAKSHLMRFLAAEIRKRGLTQAAAGELLGLDQPNVSALVNEKISRFSVEKLMQLVARLGYGVSIRIEGGGVAFDVPLRTAA